MMISFILSLFVILIHISSEHQYLKQIADDGSARYAVTFLYNFVKNTFSRVAVPLFFVISGAVFFRDYQPGMYAGKIKTRIKSLFIPYLLWNTLVMFFRIFCSYTPIYHLFVGRERFVVTVPNLISGVFLYSCNPVFFFIFNLIIYVLLTPFFDYIMSSKWSAWIITVLALVVPSIVSSIFGDDIEPHIANLLGYLIWYVIGVLIGKHYFSLFVKQTPRILRLPCACICVLCIILQLMNIYGVIHPPLVGSQILVVFFCAAFWIASDSFVENIKLRPFMYYSFFIYALHVDVQAVYVKLIYLLGPKNMWMAFPNLLIAYPLTILTVIVIAAFLEKKIPFVYMVLSGNRQQ